jgi:osmotically-inducible protein OsmY
VEPEKSYGYGGFREDLLYKEDWMKEGPHSGRGPSGYRRLDERIEEGANERLTPHGELDASGIKVHVENGEITLEGTVDSRRSKRMAEDVPETITGVRDIHNWLRLQQEP